MNNYIKILLYLKKFEGDGKEHPIEQLFPELLDTDIQNILQELSNENFIKYSGREDKYLSFDITKDLLTNNAIIRHNSKNLDILNSEPEPFKAKITFKGSKYLKEELQMQESGKYNISVNGKGATNNFVIESSNVSIYNKTNFKDTTDKIINKIKNDNSVDEEIKVKIINDLKTANKQINQTGKVSGELVKQILQYGSNISSIGQMILTLFTL